MENEERQGTILERSRARGISLAQIARDAGVSRQAVHYVAAGKSQSARLRLLLCQRLGFEPEELGWPQYKVVEREE